MAGELGGMLIAGAGVLEIAIVALTALAVYRHWGLTLAEAAAGAAFFPALWFAFTLEGARLTGWPAVIPIIRLGALTASLVLIRRHWERLTAVRRGLIRFGRDHPLPVCMLSAAFGALAAAVVFTRDIRWPAPTFDGPATSRLAAIWEVACHPEIAGALVLPWMAYVGICCASYALARRYAWPPTAVTATLVVASMPRLVYLSVCNGVEIVPAAAALVFILFLYRTVERPDIKDLVHLPVLLVFSIAGGGLGLAFPAIGLALALGILYRRHGGHIWWALARSRPWPMLAAGLPLIVYGQGIVAGLHGRTDVGPATAWAANTEGLRGAFANLLRYGLQVLDLTPPLERGLSMVAGVDWRALRQWIHDHLLGVLTNPHGMPVAFMSASDGDRTFTWFGPLAGLLVPVAVGWALWRGPRRLKSLASGLVAYIALVALVPAWQPSNVRFFTVFFVAAGFTTAFLLPPWRMTTRRRRCLQVCALAIGAYAIGTLFQSV